MQQHFVVVTVHVLTGFTYCYVIEVFFFPPYFRSWYHLSCFSCITSSRLKVRSGLAAWLNPSLGESWGSVSLCVK